MKTIHTQAYQQFCALLVSYRKAAGMSQYDLAKALGRPQSFVAKIERHERRLDVIELVQIADALDINLCGLMDSLQTALSKSTENPQL